MSLGFGGKIARIASFIRQRIRLCRVLRRSIDPERRLVLTADIRNLDQIIEANIRLLENDRYKSFLEGIAVNSKNYGMVKRMAGLASRDPVSPLEDSTGVTAVPYIRLGRTAARPPITIYEAGVKEIRTVLASSLNPRDFTINMVRKGVISLRLSSLSTYDKVRALLDQRAYKFYTQTPKDRMPYTVVVDDSTADEIRKELCTLDFTVFVQSLVNIVPDKLLVRVDRKADIHKLYKVNRLFSLSVLIRKDRAIKTTRCYK